MSHYPPDGADDRPTAPMGWPQQRPPHSDSPPYRRDPNAPQPPRLEHADVGGATVGGRPSFGDKFLETFAVVVGPLVIPALLLGLVRAERGDLDFVSAVSVGDIAFGFVAVGFATIARSLSGRGPGYKQIGISALIVMLFQIAFAVTQDTFVKVEELVSSASMCKPFCRTVELAQMANEIQASAGGSITWSVILISGCTFGVAVITAIWMES